MCATLKKGRCEKSLFVDVWFSFFLVFFCCSALFSVYNKMTMERMGARVTTKT